MCTSYEANPNDADWDTFSLFPIPEFDYRREIYKDYVAPVFRRGAGGYETIPASFGIVPRRHIPPGVKAFDTMNARSESIGEKRSFSGAWKALQLCLIPCRVLYEPSYESGKAVQWKIGMADGQPLAIAGLWRQWTEPGGAHSTAFSMLTVNADDHPLMKRFHKPGAEKRSVVIVPPTEYADWLSCTSTDEARSFLRLYPVEAMHAEPSPLPPRKPATQEDGAQRSLLPEARDDLH
jgi:putative SOS response-associated peptidase YedK